MKRTVIVILLLFFSVEVFPQVEMEYSATPKAQAKGMSIRGLSSESVQFLSLCRQVDSLKSHSARKVVQMQCVNVMACNVAKCPLLLNLQKGTLRGN